MLAPGAGWGTPATWADLGCGTGTFTLALAELIGTGSTISAIDRDARALASLPATHHGAQIITSQADLETFDPPIGSLDGVLLANSLHYVRAQATLLATIARGLAPSGRCIIVEYDTETPLSRWVPFPVSQRAARTLFRDAGLLAVEQLAIRPSLYRRGSMYSLQARKANAVTA
jgi:ubiquinone/menaquinone biosynthesis C-methylase UbiE